MSMTLAERSALLGEVAELLALEADAIDRRRWTDWIELYSPDSLFWVPAWRSEDETTDDPEQEICLIYLPNRGIEDRVFRFTSGDAYSSTPLPNTSHVVGSIRLLSEDHTGTIDAAAKAVVATMSPRTGTQLRAVWYDYRLRRSDAGLRIAGKKVTLLEQVIDGTIDVYNI